MQYKDFMRNVETHGGMLDENQALGAVKATFQTLAERLKGGEPENLASQLPKQVGAYLCNEGKGERFSVDEFYRRVSEREHTGINQAKTHVRAVLGAVGDAVSSGEKKHVFDQLPDDFRHLFDVF